MSRGKIFTFGSHCLQSLELFNDRLIMANVTTPRSRLSMRNLSASSHQSSSPLDHSLGPAGDVDVGDRVNVPGGMDGIVKFVGGVEGKQGVFVGVELSRQWAARGKNNGDVDG